MPAGVVIAGGRSTRFGERDKAVAPLGGVPMIRRVVDRLAAAVDDLVVNCRADQVDAIAAALADSDLEPTFALDETPDQGPIAGIDTGLRATDHEYAAVVACDMPFVDPAFIEFLFEQVQGHDAAVPKPDEWYQPTQAVYRADAMATACEAALERGDHKVLDALFDIDHVTVDRATIAAQTSLRTFRNLNTQDEFEAAAAEF